MDLNVLRQGISDFLGFAIFKESPKYIIEGVTKVNGYSRTLVNYNGREGDTIPAYLLIPEGKGPFPAVLINHQHHGQRHFGKSEVCRLVGDPYQAFGPALAQRGVVVLAPDSICFEDRRRGVTGTEPDEMDVAQHYDEMCYRLLQGDTLMRKVLDDAALGISLLREHTLVDADRVGVLGYSYGGSTVLFHMALDERIRFGCSSGAAVSYKYMMANQVGVEMSRAIPGFAAKYDIADLVKCMAPRPFLIASGTKDIYSMDANEIYKEALEAYAVLDAGERLEEARYDGGHSLDEDRFGRIIEWMVASSSP